MIIFYKSRLVNSVFLGNLNNSNIFYAYTYNN
jgi:hypothetical protein